jgi:hypothetical protein
MSNSIPSKVLPNVAPSQMSKLTLGKLTRDQMATLLHACYNEQRAPMMDELHAPTPRSSRSHTQLNAPAPASLICSTTTRLPKCSSDCPPSSGDSLELNPPDVREKKKRRLLPCRPPSRRLRRSYLTSCTASFTKQARAAKKTGSLCLSRNPHER